jgi:hypothetical protein
MPNHNGRNHDANLFIPGRRSAEEVSGVSDGGVLERHHCSLHIRDHPLSLHDTKVVPVTLLIAFLMLLLAVAAFWLVPRVLVRMTARVPSRVPQKWIDEYGPGIGQSETDRRESSQD